MRQARFLDEYRQCGNIWRSCERTGTPRATVYKWQEHDEKFSMLFHQADVEATERLEEEARRRAQDGVTQEKPVFYLGVQVGSIVETEYSDGLLQFLLKARNPGKYKDRLAVESTSTVKAYGGVDVDAV